MSSAIPGEGVGVLQLPARASAMRPPVQGHADRPRGAGPAQGRRAATGGQDGATAPAQRGLSARPWWPWARRIVVGAFFVGVVAMLWLLARDLDWPAVLRSLRAYPLQTLLVAFLVGLASHLVYSVFDLFGRASTRHGLSVRRVMAVTALSYVFNLNFGSMVGGVGFRARLYTRLGLDAAQTAQIFALSLVTNWLGFFVLAAGVFTAWPLRLPAQWALGATGLQVLGWVLAGVAVAYVLLCAFAPRRSWKLRGNVLRLPTGRVAVLQCVVSTANWLLMAAMVWVLLGARVEYGLVLSCLLLASGAGLIVRVPGGVGVTETVFVTLLRDQMPVYEILAALVAYRVLYFLVPLLVALPAYGWMEAVMRRNAAGASGTGAGTQAPAP